MFPVRASLSGRCTCLGPNCTKPGKHPHIKRYLERATCDVDQISSWWAEWPNANVGIATGSGILVVDVDDDRGEAWLKAYDLPPTLGATSGRGRHLYYKGAGRGALGVGPKVDILGDKRYVVAPPSQHESGMRYAWLTDPRTTPIAIAPDWIYEVVATAHTKTATSQRGVRSDGISTNRTTTRRFIYEGCRNQALRALM